MYKRKKTAALIPEVLRIYWCGHKIKGTMEDMFESYLRIHCPSAKRHVDRFDGEVIYLCKRLPRPLLPLKYVECTAFNCPIGR